MRAMENRLGVWQHYRLNACVLPKALCWNLIPSVMVFKGGVSQGRLGHEGGALTNGTSALKKDTPERSLFPSTM